MINCAQLALLVSLKVPYIIMEIKKSLNVSRNEAFEMFYSSETYRLLSDKETYYWSESAQFVTESYIREYKGLQIEEFENI